jgi:hypothetical protein
VQRYHRYWASLIWSFSIIFLGVVTVAACVSHPAAQELKHPSLCIDSSSPAAQGDDKPILFAEGGTFPLPRERLSSMLPPVALGSYLSSGLGCLTDQLFQTQASRLSSIACTSLPVLRL